MLWFMNSEDRTVRWADVSYVAAFSEALVSLLCLSVSCL